VAVELAELLSAAARGAPPPPDGTVTVRRPPDSRSVGVFAFTAHHVVSADIDPAWVSGVLDPSDLSAPLSPPFLTALAERTGRSVAPTDLVLVRGRGDESPPDLVVADGAAHARVERADVRVWTLPGSDDPVLVLGEGVAGRWEVAVEVSRRARGRGLGRMLFAAAPNLVPPGERVWAQVAPGNPASVRAVLAAGYRPVGAEALLVPS